MQKKKNEINACRDHIEMALDDFVNKYETAPEIILDSEKKCFYCEKKADYIVRNPEEFL